VEGCILEVPQDRTRNSKCKTSTW